MYNHWLISLVRPRTVHINRDDYWGFVGFCKMIWNEPWITQKLARFTLKFALVQSPGAFYYWYRFSPENRKWHQDKDIEKRKIKFNALKEKGFTPY